jgi:hypothetical protein
MSAVRPAPDALLAVATGCAHCPTVLAGVSELVKSGAIGKLEVVNLTARPEVAQALGIRSVPWLRLGPFVLEGLRSPAELRLWAQRAVSTEGLGDYLIELLKSGKLKDAIAFCAQAPERLASLLAILERPEVELTIRIGIAAVIEDFAGSDGLRAQLERLTALSRHADAHIRGDAAHFLALTRDARAEAPLRALLQDATTPVRELAQEAIESLRAAGDCDRPPGT